MFCCTQETGKRALASVTMPRARGLWSWQFNCCHTFVVYRRWLWLRNLFKALSTNLPAREVWLWLRTHLGYYCCRCVPCSRFGGLSAYDNCLKEDEAGPLRECRNVKPHHHRDASQAYCLKSEVITQACMRAYLRTQGSGM